MPRSILCDASSPGCSDSCGTNNSQIVLGIHSSLQCKTFFRFTDPLHFVAAQAVPPMSTSRAGQGETPQAVAVQLEKVEGIEEDDFCFERY
jgi:hypothetical protein